MTIDSGYSKHLIEAVNTILDMRASPGEIYKAINRLADLFTELSTFHDDPIQASPLRTELKLPFGKAISPDDAANCMRDVCRTAQFYRGIRLGLEQLITTCSERPLRIVYAGCGPFAALVVPLMPLLEPGEIEFHLWEVHEQSLELSRQLIHQLGLEAFVGEYWLGDASLEHNLTQNVHMVITETMQAALAKEPQVAITANLAPRLPKGGILIPEKIRLIATLLDPSQEFALAQGQKTEGFRKDLGVAFELDRESVCEIEKLHAANPSQKIRIPSRRVVIPYPNSSSHKLWIRTQIRIFGAVELGDYDSGLTIPMAAPVEESLVGGEEVQFYYELGQAPGLRCEVVKP